MYESFFGLREKPFTLLPDPEYLYLSPKHQRALTLLEYGMMNQAGFSVICGDTGAGKTTLIRRLLSELGDDTTVGLITNTHQSFGELLNWVLMAFGIDGENKTKSQMHQIFIEFLIEQYARNKHTVLIVDEAQNMNADTLEELRMLSNINADKDQVLQVVLAGQPALRETLRKPELMQFAQRIAVDYYLESLSAEETHHYIQHRLKVAGADREIFTDEACETVYRYSGGTPRLINLLCDTSLVYGFAEQTQMISADLVEDVVREQHSNSIVPTFNMPKTDTTQATGHVEPQQVKAEAIIEQNNSTVSDAKEDDQEAIIAELSRRAKQAVSSVDASVRSSSNKADTVAYNNDSEPSESESSTRRAQQTESITRAVEKEKAKESKVTPINQEVSLDDLEKSHAADKDRHVEPEAVVERQQQQNEEVVQEEVIIDTPEEHRESVSQSHRSGRNEYEDVYPIIQVEDNSKKNLNLLILGIAGGMFVATIVMFVVGYMVFFNTTSQTPQEVYTQPKSITSPMDLQRQQAIENERLETLQKERDAALAITRALERERDAALAAAKAQEDMRAAERRAAEMLADQERRTAIEIRRAKEQARQAEIAAAKAQERERFAKQQAELAKQDAEKIKAEKERQQNIFAPVQMPVTEPVPVAQPPRAEPVVVEKTERKVDQNSNELQQDIKFSANPCKSPSAKFLSTCKK